MVLKMPNLSEKYKRGQHLKPGGNNLNVDYIALKLRNRQTRSNSRIKNVPPLPESSSKILTVVEVSDHNEHKVDNKMLNHETDTHDLVSTNRKRSLRFSKNDSSIDHHSIQSKNSDRIIESGNSIQKHKSSCKNLNMKIENELNKLQGSSDKDKQLLLPENSEKSDTLLKPCLVFLKRCTADKPALQPRQTSPNINGTEDSEKSNAESSKKYSFPSKNLPHNYGSLSDINSGKKFTDESLDKIECSSRKNTCENESGRKPNPVCPKKKYSLRSKISFDKSHSLSDIYLEKEFLKESSDGVECDSKQNTSNENGEISKTESLEKVDNSEFLSDIDSKTEDFTKESFDKVECASRENTAEDESAGKSNSVCPKKYSLRSKISSNTSHPLSDISLEKEFLKESSDGIECDSEQNASDESGEKSKTLSQKMDDNSISLLDIDSGRTFSEESLDKVDCASRQNSCENESSEKTNPVCSKRKYSLRSKISPDKSHLLSDINLGKEFLKESLGRVECDSEQNASDESGEKSKTVLQKKDDNSLSDIYSGRFSELSLDKAECASRQNSCENEISEKSNPICPKKKYPLSSKISPDKSHSLSINLGKEILKESLDEVECNSEQNTIDHSGEKSNPVSSKRKYSFRSTNSSNKSYSSSDIDSINEISRDLLDGVECDLKQSASENESGEKSNVVSQKNNNSFCSENVSDNSSSSEIESRKRDFSKCDSSDSNSGNESFEKSDNVSRKKKYSLHSKSVSDNSYSSSKIDTGKRESSCENSDFILKPAVQFKPCQVLLTKLDDPCFENELPVKSGTTVEPALNEGEHKISQRDEESSFYLRANLFEESGESDEENIEIIYSTFELVETRSTADNNNIYSQVVEKEESSSKFVDRDPKLLPVAQKEDTFSRNGIKRKKSVETPSSESENDDDPRKKRKMTLFQRKGTLVDNIELKKNEKTNDNFSEDSVKTRKTKSSGNRAGLSQKSDECVNEIEDEICRESGSSDADDEDNLSNEPQNKKSKLIEQSSPSSHSPGRKKWPKNKIDSQKTSRKRFEFDKNLDLGILKKGGRLSSSQGSSPEYDSSERDELFQKLLSCPSTSGCEEPKPSTSAGETSKPKKIQQLSMSECCEFEIKNDDHSPDEIAIVKNNVKSPESEEILSDEDEIPCEVVEIEDNVSQSDKDESAYESASSGEGDHNFPNVYDNIASHSKFIHDSRETPSCSYAPDQPSTSQDIDESWDRDRLSNRFGRLTPMESSLADPGNICKFRTRNGNLYKVDYFEYQKIKKLYVHLDVSGQIQQFSPCNQCKKNRIRREKHVSTKFHSLGAYNKKHDADHPQHDDLSDGDEDHDQTVPELNLSSDYGYCKSALLSNSSDSEDRSDDSGMEEKENSDSEEQAEPHRTKRQHKPEVDNDDSNDSVTMNSDYYCVHCGFKFLNKKENYHHTCGGKPRKGFLCMYCERIFPTYDQLSNHKKMHTG